MKVTTGRDAIVYNILVELGLEELSHLVDAYWEKHVAPNPLEYVSAIKPNVWDVARQPTRVEAENLLGKHTLYERLYNEILYDAISKVTHPVPPLMLVNKNIFDGKDGIGLATDYYEIPSVGIETRVEEIPECNESQVDSSAEAVMARDFAAWLNSEPRGETRGDEAVHVGDFVYVRFFGNNSKSRSKIYVDPENAGRAGTIQHTLVGRRVGHHNVKVGNLTQQFHIDSIVAHKPVVTAAVEAEFYLARGTKDREECLDKYRLRVMADMVDAHLVTYLLTVAKRYASDIIFPRVYIIRRVQDLDATLRLQKRRDAVLASCENEKAYQGMLSQLAIEQSLPQIVLIGIARQRGIPRDDMTFEAWLEKVRLMILREIAPSFLQRVIPRG